MLYELTPEERNHYEILVADWNTLCAGKEKNPGPISWEDLSPALQHEVDIRGLQILFRGERPLSTVGGVVGLLVNEVFVAFLHGMNGLEFIDDGVVD